MHSALNQFHENIKRVNALGGLGVAIDGLTTSAVDTSDILRSQLVLAVSALDQFVHELVRLGMIEVAKGNRGKTDAYLRFLMPISAVDAALSGLGHEQWMGENVRQRHSWLSFQEPERIADAIRLISPIKLWEAVANEFGIAPQDVKTRLSLIVERRNKIAHEADIDPAYPGSRWPIDTKLVADTIEFIERLVGSIFKAVV